MLDLDFGLAIRGTYRQVLAAAETASTWGTAGTGTKDNIHPGLLAREMWPKAI